MTKPLAVTYYELPPEGITLLGYVVRRMHKTRFLVEASTCLRSAQSAEALALFGLYALAASASFGPAFYQPDFNEAGAEFSEADPETGAAIKAILHTKTPSYRISYTADLPDGSTFSGQEEILGTSLGFRGLRMPAPAEIAWAVTQLDYDCEAHGTLVSELYYRFGDGAWVRGVGDLELGDSEGNYGAAQLTRNGVAQVTVHAASGGQVSKRFEFPSA